MASMFMHVQFSSGSLAPDGALALFFFCLLFCVFVSAQCRQFSMVVIHACVADYHMIHGKNTTLGNISFENTKAGAAEQFLMLCCKATARVR